MVETARDHLWSLDFTKRGNDTIHIIAIRVEFERDTSTLTTGDGRFGMRGDTKEQRFYAQDTVYRFDNLPHDSLYFVHQLTALRNYYDKVSRGSLTLDFSVHPAGGGETGYRVPNQMPYYSPGWKRRQESIYEYWDRKTHGLVMFVRDAIRVAGQAPDSPFRNLYRDENGILRDADTHRKTAVLIFHAGASYLTDGGLGGTAAADSPSDMIDAFINQDFFRLFRDTLGLDTTGITVTGSQGQNIIIDEVMMAPETSNQDGLNWGIQGILVNQLARQLGVPDLFSTASGVSAIGAFCIMDFAGYSAGQGFIPPYPSAWVRAFMGWDTPRVAEADRRSYVVKALTYTLDGEGPPANGNDTTILLVPLNNNEFYLIENRQRNLSGERDRFNYKSDGRNIIDAYPFNVNLPANVRARSNDSRRVILETENNDVSLPASGMLVWHVDERIIRQRLQYNFVNADSSYRGVRLVEADGINDLGEVFIDAFYQAAFDYGGAEDVFPHSVVRNRDNRGGGENRSVYGFGPYTRPSTRSNDGGHTYISIDFNTASTSPRREIMLNSLNDTITNFSDSAFIVGVYRHQYLVQGWPRRAAAENFFDPLITPIALSPTGNGLDTVLTLLSESGRLYIYSINGDRPESYGNNTASVTQSDYHGNTISTPINVTFFDSIPGVFTFPTAIDNRIFIPSALPDQNRLYIYSSININDGTAVVLPAAPTSYVCGIDAGTWAVGLTDGRIATGVNENIGSTIQLNSNSPVRALAVLRDSAETFAAIQDDGTLSIIRRTGVTGSVRVRNGIPPFSIVTGDLDNDGRSELIISDSRQGVWVYTRDLQLAQGWRETPNDWAGAYHIDPERRTERERFPMNPSAPALADLNRNGLLDIVVSGINGIFALNLRGALLSRWPAKLDNRYWYERGTITTSPVIVSEGRNQPLVLFSSPTGERATFDIVKIETADKARGVVTFRKDNGALDSLWGLSASIIDTILTIGDSLIYPYILPGGFVDALTPQAVRPVEQIGSWRVPQSRWPLSAGAPITTSPVVFRAVPNSVPDLFAVASDGMIYRWRLNGIISDSLFWPQNGFDAARSFAYGGPLTPAEEIVRQQTPIIFWNYPNPTPKGAAFTTFKYQFSGPATNVRLDIQTITGRTIDSFRNLPAGYPDWNEVRVDLRKYGQGIYRCRMEATINGRKYSRMWKMAVTK
jgi:hypothetical protein